MAYIFLKDLNEFSATGEYLAVDESRIETIPVADTYGDYGQIIGHDDAGDSITFITQRAVDVANAAYNAAKENDEDELETPHKLEHYITAYENREEFAAVMEECEEDVDFYLHQQTVRGFNFWDGHNHASVIISREDTEFVKYEEEDDDEIIARLNAAIENATDCVENQGRTTCYYLDAQVTTSAWQGEWENYSITLDNDFEDAE